MQCKCGGEVIESSHEVKTMKTASEWLENALTKPDKIDLPVTVEKHKCAGCGRSHHFVWNQ